MLDFIFIVWKVLLERKQLATDWHGANNVVQIRKIKIYNLKVVNDRRSSLNMQLNQGHDIKDANDQTLRTIISSLHKNITPEETEIW